MNTEKMIAAAEKHADLYCDDDRQHIKTDVMNAFFSGVKYCEEEIAEPKRQLAEREWTKYEISQQIEVCRAGWPGAWDAFVAALLRKPQLNVTRPITLSFYVKGDVKVDCVQAELGETK